MPAKFEDLFLALDAAISDGPLQVRSYVCRQTGETYLRSEDGGVDEYLPKNLDDGDKYLELPSKRDLDLGRPLVMDFVRQFLPADYDKVREMFGRRGAYARFKQLLRHRNAVTQWRDFEAKVTERALRDWCAANAIALED